MRSFLLLLLIAGPFTGFSQLDTLKGNPKSVRDSMSYIDLSAGVTLILRCGYNFGQYSLDEETILKELKTKGKYPRIPLRDISERNYDQKGRLIKSVTFHSDTSISKYEYSYDEYGNKVRDKRIYRIGKYEMIRVTDYIFHTFEDSADRVVSSLEYGIETGGFILQRYFYDNRGQLIEVREFTNNIWDRRTNYLYNEKGKLLTEVYYHIEQRKEYERVSAIPYFRDTAIESYREIMAYDCDGDLIEKKIDCDPKCYRAVHAYDPQKRVSRTWFYTNDSLVSRREYEYNDDNKILKLSWFHSGGSKPTDVAEYFYKEKELVKTVFTENDKTTVTEFSYKFDSHDNWIEQVKKVNGNIVYVRNRTISYWN